MPARLAAYSALSARPSRASGASPSRGYVATPMLTVSGPAGNRDAVPLRHRPRTGRDAVAAFAALKRAP